MTDKIVIDGRTKTVAGVTTKRELIAHFGELKRFMQRIQCGG